MVKKGVQARIERVVDEHEIERILSAWGFARDCGDWNVLQDCFQPDATINISWFSGPATQFIEQSKTMVTGLKAGEHSKHQIGRARICVDRNRAISECHAELIRRVVADPFDFDTITWGRFFDLFEKREDGVWRIFRRTMVYEKDRLDPINPADVPAGYFESLDLAHYPAACRALCYRLALNGHTPMKNIIEAGSSGEIRLKKEAEDWLAAEII